MADIFSTATGPSKALRLERHADYLDIMNDDKACQALGAKIVQAIRSPETLGLSISDEFKVAARALYERFAYNVYAKATDPQDYLFLTAAATAVVAGTVGGLGYNPLYYGAIPVALAPLLYIARTRKRQFSNFSQANQRALHAGFEKLIIDTFSSSENLRKIIAGSNDLNTCISKLLTAGHDAGDAILVGIHEADDINKAREYRLADPIITKDHIRSTARDCAVKTLLKLALGKPSAPAPAAL